MIKRQIEPAQTPDEEAERLNLEIQEAREALLQAEADLAKEQAAVNAFRMHCRLKLDRWIETLIDLQAERQSLLTRLQLLRQAEDFGIPFDEENPFWQGEEDQTEESDDDDELLLPTDVPRDKAAEKRLFRKLARRFHPDLGQTTLEISYRSEMMVAVNLAYTTDDIQALYDLADQLDPTDAAELASIQSLEIRELQKQLIRLRQRRRKAKRRLAALREENTARLWKKAQRLDEDDVHWWEIVRREIEQAIERLSQEITHLDEQIVAIEPYQESETSE